MRNIDTVFASVTIAILALAASMGCNHAAELMTTQNNAGESACSRNGEKRNEALGDDRQRFWSEPDNLNQAERMRWRPGNYTALGAVVEFLNARYEVRPRLARVVFPCAIQSITFESLNQYEQVLLAREADLVEGGDTLRNKVRASVLQVRSLEMINVEATQLLDDALAALDAPTYVVRDMVKIRAFHRGAAVLIRGKILFESLQSEKIEGAEDDPDSFSWFLAVWSEGTWMVCYYGY